MDKYLEDDEQKNLKGMLYSYLQDKASRRAGVTSKDAYEGGEKAFMNQMALHDLGSLAGSLSEAGAMAGTIDGKYAKSDIIPKMNDNLYKTNPGAYENFRTLRDMEERSNMNDLRVADYITGIESREDQNKLATRDRDFREQSYKDGEADRDLKRQMLRKQLAEKKRVINDDVAGPGGRPAAFDAEGNPTLLPDGYKFRPGSSSRAGIQRIVPGYEDEGGNPLMQNPDGTYSRGKLPEGFKRSQKQDEKLTADERTRGLQSEVAMKEVARIEGIEDRYTPGAKDLLTDMVPDAIGGNYLKSEDQQRYDAANSAIADVMLRSKSGANFTKDELITQLKSYSIKPGDKPATKADKRLRRREFIESMIGAAGRGSKGVEMPPDNNAINKKTVSRKQYSPSTDKTRITYSDGTVEVLDGRK